MNIELKELELEWPPEISVFHLKDYVLSKLIHYGEPLRWAITSLTHTSGGGEQKIYIEAVFILDEDKKKEINSDLN